MNPCKIANCEIAPCKMDLCEMDPCKMDSCEIAPCKITYLQKCFFAINRLQKWACKMSLCKKDPCEIDPCEITYLQKCFYAKMLLCKKSLEKMRLQDISLQDFPVPIWKTLTVFKKIPRYLLIYYIIKYLLVSGNWKN